MASTQPYSTPIQWTDILDFSIGDYPGDRDPVCPDEFEHWKSSCFVEESLNKIVDWNGNLYLISIQEYPQRASFNCHLGYFSFDMTLSQIEPDVMAWEAPALFRVLSAAELKLPRCLDGSPYDFGRYIGEMRHTLVKLLVYPGRDQLCGRFGIEIEGRS